MRNKIKASKEVVKKAPAQRNVSTRINRTSKRIIRRELH